LFVFLLCIVYPMLSFFLDFPFLIAPSVFDNVYLHKCPCKYRYISVLAKCSTKPLSKLSTSILSAVKPGFRITVALDTQELMSNRCGFWQISKICYDLGSSPLVVAFIHMTSLPSTQLFATKLKRNKWIGSNVFHYIRMDNIDKNTLS
jgi:hypothetical protein